MDDSLCLLRIAVLAMQDCPRCERQCGCCDYARESATTQSMRVDRRFAEMMATRRELKARRAVAAPSRELGTSEERDWLAEWEHRPVSRFVPELPADLGTSLHVGPMCADPMEQSLRESPQPRRLGDDV